MEEAAFNSARWVSSELPPVWISVVRFARGWSVPCVPGSAGEFSCAPSVKCEVIPSQSPGLAGPPDPRPAPPRWHRDPGPGSRVLGRV